MKKIKHFIRSYLIDKRFVIISFVFPIDCPVHLFYRSARVQQKIFPSCYRTHSYQDATRLNVIGAVYYCLYLKITHKWMGNIKIKNQPFFWWEKLKNKVMENKKIKKGSTVEYKDQMREIQRGKVVKIYKDLNNETRLTIERPFNQGKTNVKAKNVKLIK